ncbi:MAG: acyl-homoserine-lactone acylase [Flavobacteriales bacterium]|jgi:acyl-homoserine-lactone acylase
MVLPGGTSATLWNTYLTEDELAQNLNPECGYLFNANNDIFNNTYDDEICDANLFPISIGYEAGKMTNRGNRSQDILEQLSQIDYHGVKALKFDTSFPDSMIFLKRYPIYDMFSYKPEEHPELADVIRKFNRWDFKGDTNNIDAAIVYTTFYMMYHDTSATVKELSNNDSLRMAFLLDNMKKAKDRLMKHFGTIDIPLGKVQVLSEVSGSLA